MMSVLSTRKVALLIITRTAIRPSMATDQVMMAANSRMKPQQARQPGGRRVERIGDHRHHPDHRQQGRDQFGRAERRRFFGPEKQAERFWSGLVVWHLAPEVAVRGHCQR